MEPGSGLKLHHVGIVVPSIEKHREFYIAVLHYRERTSVIHDAVQTAFVQFFALGGADHYIELVAPDSESSKLANASRRGLPLNHLCYSCDDARETTENLRSSGCFVIQGPVPATAFDGRPIAWFMTPDRMLLEIVERGVEGTL
jgi:catechol 2,3-dioxygenase-like lactoylglutathione lyase family enzyme